MEVLGLVVAIFLLIGIAGAIVYLLLFEKKRRDLESKGLDAQHRESLEESETTELPRREEIPNYAVLEEKEQDTEITSLLSEKEELLATPEESRRLRPIQRGGRKPYGTQDEKPQERDSKPRRPKPEFVCWEKGRQWILAVELPKELYSNGDVVVTQNSRQLEKDTSRDYCWRLTEAFGKVFVNSIEPVDLGKEGENYLLFKLSGENRREGRLVKSKSPSSGDYLVVVPADWKIANDIAVSNQQINVGYQAYWHTFDMADNRKMIFTTSKGEKKIQSNAPVFRLIGSSLNDASENIGTLFIENPPRISAHDITDWNDVGTIVIGDIGENKWRAEVPLTLEEATQNLPKEVLEKPSGWYFLRFYDKHDELMESLDFRFVRGLKKIKIPNFHPFPELEDRHETVQVEIMHESDFVIESANVNSINISVKSTKSTTVLSIPPNPDYDKTIWRIGHGSGSKVELTILLERIWWGIGTDVEKPSVWKDQLETLTKESFEATSNSALWLRFPTQRWIKRATVGFQKEHTRDYLVGVLEQTVCIRLGDFEVGDLYHNNLLRVWLECGGKQYEGTVIVVSELRPDWVGIGRKQTAKAMAMMRKGTGEMKVNGFSITEYFQKAPADAMHYWRKLSEHDQIRNVLSQLDISFRVWGSSPHTKRQVKAVTHALAHALMQYQPELKPTLNRFRGARVSQSAYDDEEGSQNESD